MRLVLTQQGVVPTRGSWRGYLLFVVVLDLVVVVLLSLRLPHLWTLTEQGVSGVATIVALEPHNHATVHYRYTVEGQDYESFSSPWGGGMRPFEQLRVGDRVPITYLPTAPDQSLLGDPYPLLVNAARDRGIIAVGLPFLLIALAVLVREWKDIFPPIILPPIDKE